MENAGENAMHKSPIQNFKVKRLKKTGSAINLGHVSARKDLQSSDVSLQLNALLTFYIENTSKMKKEGESKEAEDVKGGDDVLAYENAHEISFQKQNDGKCISLSNDRNIFTYNTKAGGKNTSTHMANSNTFSLKRNINIEQMINNIVSSLNLFILILG
jgi:hypothetical protein